MKRAQVGPDVGPAERVDGLLRIAHEHERPARTGLTEESREDLPLDGVRVLELVDEHDLESISQGLADRGCPLTDERVAQLGQHVVEADPAEACAPIGDRIERLEDQGPEEDLCLGRTIGGARSDLQVGTAGDHLRGVDQRAETGKEVGGRDAERGRGEDVGTRALDRSGVVLDELRPGIDARGRSEEPAHLSREAVDRGDRGGVELAQGPTKALEPERPVLGGQMIQKLGVGAGARTVVQEGCRVDELLADPCPELMGGGPGEGHDEQLAGRVPALGQVARRERRQRGRLSRSGTRLDHRNTLGEGAGRLEGRIVGRSHDPNPFRVVDPDAARDGSCVVDRSTTSHSSRASRSTRPPRPGGSPGRAGNSRSSTSSRSP